jgi:hypothetical protein
MKFMNNFFNKAPANLAFSDRSNNNNNQPIILLCGLNNKKHRAVTIDLLRLIILNMINGNLTESHVN